LRQLFSIELDGDVTLQDDTFRLIPELRKVHEELGDKFIRYVVLLCDYSSPYRQMIESKRIEELCDDIFGKPVAKVKELKNEHLKTAIDKYKRLQYDPLREQYNVYTEKISEYNQYIMDMPVKSENSESLQRVMIGLEKITESREKIKKMILKKDEEDQMRGGGEASLLEEMLE